MKLKVGINPKIRKLFKLCKSFFTPIALVFIVASIYQSRLIVRDAWIDSQPYYLVIAVVLWMLAHLFSPWFVSIILNACGAKIPYRDNLALHLNYLPARYIPGGVWHTVARVTGLHHLGVQPINLTSFVIVENLVALCITLVVGGIFISFDQKNTYLKITIYLVVALCIILLLMCPYFLNKFLLKNKFIKYKKYIAGLLVAIFFWMIASISFLFYISSFFEVNSLNICIKIIGSYLFAWGVGFISLFAPQGFGIFELVAAKVMPLNFNFSATVGIMAGFRLIVMSADLLMWICWKTFRFFLD